MQLTPMRYKDYIWPHNPATYSITYQRHIAVHKVPFGRYCMQDLGQGCRIMRGAGEFAGEGAYEEFKRLATVFYGEGPGLLVHPLWQVSNAYFTALRLEQEPTPDYVRYSFTFQERFDGYSEHLTDLSDRSQRGDQTSYTVASGDTLWAIALRHGVSTEALLAANPGIKNPSLIQVGEVVVIPC